jgi:hypothetical protein
MYCFCALWYFYAGDNIVTSNVVSFLITNMYLFPKSLGC